MCAPVKIALNMQRNLVHADFGEKDELNMTGITMMIIMIYPFQDRCSVSQEVQQNTVHSCVYIPVRNNI